MTTNNTPTPTTGKFTYHRGTDGCDETWDVCYPDGGHLASIHFWERAAEAEAEARMIVHRLNSHDEVLTALNGRLAIFDEETAAGVMRRDGRVTRARRDPAKAAAPRKYRSSPTEKGVSTMTYPLPSPAPLAGG